MSSIKSGFLKFFPRLWSVLEKYLSEEGTESFARLASAYLVLYYTVQQAWYFHITGRLADPSVVLAHATAMATFYGVNKTHNWLTTKSTAKNGSGDDSADEKPGEQAPQ